MVIIWILLGGALGALSRFGLSTSIHALVGRSFPYGTLSVNAVGCLLAGFLYLLLLERWDGSADQWRSFLVVGFLGGLTTFSAFSLETVALMQEGRHCIAGINVLLNVVICLVAVIIGMKLARLL